MWLSQDSHTSGAVSTDVTHSRNEVEKMKQIAEINYEAMYWTAQSEVATLKAEAIALWSITEAQSETLRADCNDLEADTRELAVDNEALKAIAADLKKELAEAKAESEGRLNEIQRLREVEAENEARLIHGAKIWDENQELKRDIADLKKKRS